jgi:hypothetical protein
LWFGSIWNIFEKHWTICFNKTSGHPASKQNALSLKIQPSFKTNFHYNKITPDIFLHKKLRLTVNCEKHLVILNTVLIQ